MAASHPKLVLVEGIMGAGKSSTAEYIDNYLKDRDIQTDLYLEGNLDHPADFEYTACLTESEFQTLCNDPGSIKRH